MDIFPSNGLFEISTGQLPEFPYSSNFLFLRRVSTLTMFKYLISHIEKSFYFRFLNHTKLKHGSQMVNISCDDACLTCVHPTLILTDFTG